MSDLVRSDEKERAEACLEALLLEGLDSGAEISVTPEFWDTLRGKLIARRSKRNNSR
jgi:hypothetical protein